MCYTKLPVGRFVVLLMLLASGCGGESRTRSSTVVIGVGSDTTGELAHANLTVPHAVVVPTILFHSDSLSTIGRLGVLDQFVIVLQPYNPPHLLVIDTLTGGLVGGLGRNGDGPGEFRFPGEITRGIVPGELWVSDPALGRLTPITLRNGQVAIDTSRIISTNIGGLGFAGWQWTASSFLVGGILGGGRFRLIDRTGTVVQELGSWEVEDPAIPVAIQHTANRELIDLDRAGKRIVGVGVMTATVRLYDSTGHLITEGVPPYRIVPYYRVGTARGEPSFQPQPATRYGYVGVATTESRIFALFSGRTIGAYMDGTARGRFIHIFDWDGQLRGVLELPEAIRGMAVLPDGATLYATALEPEPAVLRIRVPAPFR